MWWYPALALVLAAVVLVAGHRQRALLRVVLVALAVSAVAWLAGLALTFTGWKDIDGWVDCQDCHGWHHFGALLFWTPLSLTVVLAVAAVLVGITRLTRARSV